MRQNLWMRKALLRITENRMFKPAIIVIAYNREASLKRLLKSLNNAVYDYDDINLIISIDKSDNTKVPMVANAFDWKYGEKRVVIREERMGLKKHVLACGDYVDEFESIIVLEDDLFVSKEFYSYTCKALEFTSDNDRVAGISLYNHQLNVHAREPFEAIDDGYDNYYMQFAQSWGQAYSKKQWHGFKEWLKLNESKPVAADNVPANVSSWSDKSWLKYYIKYVIETDRYFLYPRISMTTNFGDEGTHAKSADTDLQVVMSGKSKRDYCFSNLSESDAVYDAFFENKNLSKYIQNIIGSSDNSAQYLNTMAIDLYGYRGKGIERYLLTSKALPYKLICSYGRQLRPVEANIINEIEGNDLFLYDTTATAEAPHVNDAARVLYNYRALNVKKMFEVMKHRIFNK